MAIPSKSHTVDPDIAKRPSDLEALPDLLEEINKGVQAVITGTEVNRQELVLKCRSLAQALETPRETMIRHTCADTGTLGALSFGVDSGLWVLMARNGDEPQKVADLASELGVDPVLLSRIMRHLGATGHLVETGEDEYRATNFTKAMSLPLIGNGYLAMHCTSPGALRFHEFARKRGWKNPTDANDTAMMYACGTDKDMFAWQQHLGYETHFHDLMAGKELGQKPWMDPSIYPVQERLVDGADEDPDAPFLVDIGGCTGEVLGGFKRAYPDVPGKLILQDLPGVVAQANDLDKSIVKMGYDFHETQPVQAARAYYMRYILHDWPDHVCESILSRVKEAMKPGYSRLLINEHVIPPTKARWEATGLDMVMLTIFSSQERTLRNWHDLLETKAGFRIVKIWDGDRGMPSLIECELPL